MSRLRRRKIEQLIAGLSDENGDVRTQAAEALGDLGDPAAVEPLIAALKEYARKEYRPDAVMHALEKLGTPAVEPLIGVLAKGASPVSGKAAQVVGQRSANAARVLGRLGDHRAVEPLIDALGDEYTTRDAMRALQLLHTSPGDPRAKELAFGALLEQTRSESPETRVEAARILGELGRSMTLESNAQAIAALSQLLDDPYAVTTKEEVLELPSGIQIPEKIWAAEANTYSADLSGPGGRWKSNDVTTYPVREVAVKALEQIGGPEGARVLDEYRLR